MVSKLEMYIRKITKFPAYYWNDYHRRMFTISDRPINKLDYKNTG